MPHPDRTTLAATTNRNEVKRWKGAEGPKRSAEAKRNGLSVRFKSYDPQRGQTAPLKIAPAPEAVLSLSSGLILEQEHQQSSPAASVAAPDNAADLPRFPFARSIRFDWQRLTSVSSEARFCSLNWELNSGPAD